MRSLSSVLRRLHRGFARATLLAVVTVGAFASTAVCQEPVAVQVDQAMESNEILMARAPIDVSSSHPDAKLTLQDLEGIALSNNPSVARAMAQVGVARGNWVQVGLAPNPYMGYQGQQIGSRGLAEQHGISIGQEIVRGQKLRLNRNTAFHDVARAEQELVAAEQRVRTDVRISFYQTLIAQRQIDVTQELRRIGGQAVTTSQALFNAKEVSKTDVLQAQIEIENAEILSQNASNRHMSNWRSLTAVIGQPTLLIQPLSGRADEAPEVYDFDEALMRLQTTSPEIAAAVASIERARWAYQRALAEPRPNVTVEGLFNLRDNGIGGRSDGGIAVSMPIPIWNRNQGGVYSAYEQIVAAEQSLAQLELDLQNRLAPVYERYANAKNQVERYQSKILPAARESLDLTGRMYQAGEIGFINLLTAQRTFFQTNLSYLESLRELRTAEAEIDGLLLSGSLSLNP